MNILMPIVFVAIVAAVVYFVLLRKDPGKLEKLLAAAGAAIAAGIAAFEGWFNQLVS